MTIARKPPSGPSAGPPGKRPAAKRATSAQKAPAPRKKAAPKLPAADKTPGTPRKKASAAGPRAMNPAKKSAEAISALDALQAVIVTSLDEDKAENIVTIDLSGRAAFCDRMVIATGLADRQITAMAQHLQDKLEKTGIKHVPIEGAGGSDWVLIDAGDIVVHLFKPDARDAYALEKMWGKDLDHAEDASSVG